MKSSSNAVAKEDVLVVANKLIKCAGFQIPKKLPFRLSCNLTNLNTVHCVTAPDVLTPRLI